MTLPEPIVVVGTPRSGTSMIAGLLAQLGAWVGICRMADEHNPKGYFENEAFRSLRHQSPRIKHEQSHLILKHEGYGGGPWLVKHTPMYWKWWTPVHRPKFLCVFRDPQASLDSYCDFLGHRHTREKLEKEIYRDRRIMLNEMMGYEKFFVSADLVASGNFRELRDTVGSLGIEWDQTVASEWVDHSLWHH